MVVESESHKRRNIDANALEDIDDGEDGDAKQTFSVFEGQLTGVGLHTVSSSSGQPQEPSEKGRKTEDPSTKVAL